VGTLQDASRTPAPPEGATRKIPPSARPTPSSHQRRPLTRAKLYSFGEERQLESLLLDMQDFADARLCMWVRRGANPLRSVEVDGVPEQQTSVLIRIELGRRRSSRRRSPRALPEERVAPEQGCVSSDLVGCPRFSVIASTSTCPARCEATLAILASLLWCGSDRSGPRRGSARSPDFRSTARRRPTPPVARLGRSLGASLRASRARQTPTAPHRCRHLRLRLLERRASEYGTLRHGDGDQGRGDRRRMSFMLPSI